MSINFTYSVPDELWVDSFTANNVFTGTYNGPDILPVVVDNEGQPQGVYNSEMIINDATKQEVINVDATLDTAVAYMIYTAADAVKYTYTTETNHDGSTYQRITNPKLQDYYSITYHGGPTSNTWTFNLKTKLKDTQSEIDTRKNLEFVKSKLQYVGLDGNLANVYNNFILSCENYLTTMADVYPWKYVTIPSPSVPQIPLSLITIINQIPNI